jgi:uncharacterized protein YjbI with pentapeptide repeats
MNDTHYDIVTQGHDAITKWRVEHATDILDLMGADLRGADLTYADLRGADLTYADLTGADLTGADLTGADLTGANLTGADLTGANLKGANLTGADLTCAYLKRANLRGADLTYADLTYADLTYANLTGADLTGANMWNTIGNSREVKTVQTDLWTVTYTADIMQIGCRRHAIKDWWDFDDATISAMDSKALGWWMRWKPILQQIIVTSQTTPTNNKEEK